MASNTSPPRSEYDLIVQHNIGLGQLFESQVRLNPEAKAVVHGECILTYGEVHARALNLAWKLREHDFLLEEPVGILVSPGVADVVTQIAVIYAGGSCVPVDPLLSDEQVESRLAKAGARYLLVDSTNRNRLGVFRRFVVPQHGGLGQTTCESVHNNQIPTATSLEHRTHLIHTSGTTSEPKAVQILARSILEVVYHFPFEPVDHSDAVAHVNNTSFDVSLVDIWAPLLRGARVVVLSKNILLDPAELAENLERFQVTVMATTSAVLNLAALSYPKAFARLKTCMIGGEVAKPAAVMTILEQGPPGQLINAYGPTECCVFALAHRVTLDDARGESVSIGKPIGKTSAYILDDYLMPVKDGEIGELYIGGPGVSRGYINNWQKNAEVFRELNCTTTSSGAARVYRTGDFVRRETSGLVSYVGRRDNQVKIRGFRIELEAVEAALVKTGCFSAAAALKVDLPNEQMGAILVAYAVPNFLATEPLVGIADRLRIMLPEYMVPRIELVDQLPLTPHDKIDRKKLTAMYLNKCLPVQKPAEEILVSTLDRLQRLWQDTLGLGLTRFEESDDFFLLGGTSLQAAVLIHQIRQEFHIEISSLTLYDNSTLSELATVIDNYEGGNFSDKDEQARWLEDAKLADHITCPARAPRDWRRDTEGRVLLTGATGFVGAFFLVELLKMPDVRQVGCLVRASDAAAGLLRIRQALEKYELWNDSLISKLIIFAGTLDDEDLGLGPDRFEEIAEWASVVFHFAARVNYIQPYSVHRAANVIGTLNILRLVTTGRPKALHYVSSISCYGPTGLVTGLSKVYEDDSVLCHLDAISYDHGYAQSKWVAEHMVQGLIDGGFPAAIYRLGSVTGHTVSGVGNPDDFLSRLVATCLEMGSYPSLPSQRKDVVPVDYVCCAILHISSFNKNLGHAYHIVPHSSLYASVDETFELIARCSEQHIKGLSYPEWVEKLARFEASRLKPLQPMLEQKVYNGLTRWEMYNNMAEYQTDNTDLALADYPGGLECPPLDEGLVRVYLSRWKSA